MIKFMKIYFASVSWWRCKRIWCDLGKDFCYVAARLRRDKSERDSGDCFTVCGISVLRSLLLKHYWYLSGRVMLRQLSGNPHWQFDCQWDHAWVSLKFANLQYFLEAYLSTSEVNLWRNFSSNPHEKSLVEKFSLAIWHCNHLDIMK